MTWIQEDAHWTDHHLPCWNGLCCLHIENFSSPFLDLFVLFPAPSLYISLPPLRCGDGFGDKSPPSFREMGFVTWVPPLLGGQHLNKTTFFYISIFFLSIGFCSSRQRTCFWFHWQYWVSDISPIKCQCILICPLLSVLTCNFFF